VSLRNEFDFRSTSISAPQIDHQSRPSVMLDELTNRLRTNLWYRV